MTTDPQFNKQNCPKKYNDIEVIKCISTSRSVLEISLNKEICDVT